MSKFCINLSLLFLLLIFSNFTTFAQSDPPDDDDSLVVFDEYFDSSFYNGTPISEFQQQFDLHHSVIRLQSQAIIGVTYHLENISIPILFSLVKNNQTTAPNYIDLNRNELFFSELELDQTYTLRLNFRDTFIDYAEISTFEFYKDAFNPSNNLFDVLTQWQPLDLQEGDDLASTVFNSHEVFIIERLSYIQALWDIDAYPDLLTSTENPANLNNVASGYQIDPNGNPSDLENLFTIVLDIRVNQQLENIAVDPLSLSPCICQYSLTTNYNQGEETKYKNDNTFNLGIIQQGRTHFDIGAVFPGTNTNTFEQISQGFAGPAKSIEYTYQSVYKPFDTKQRSHGSLSSSNYRTYNYQIHALFNCDNTLPKKVLNRINWRYIHQMGVPSDITQELLDVLVPVPPEDCACEKEVELCYLYDSELILNTSKTTYSGKKKAHSVGFIQDNIIIDYQLGNQPFETIKQGSVTLSRNCGRSVVLSEEDQAEKDRIDQINDDIDDKIDAKEKERTTYQEKINTELAKTNPNVANITLWNNAITVINVAIIALDNSRPEFKPKSSSSNTECGLDNNNLHLSGCHTVTIPSGQKLVFGAYSDFKINTSGRREFELMASIASNFYLTAMLKNPNPTNMDEEYCCSKKWGSYATASFDLSPKSLQTLKSTSHLGGKFFDNKPWDNLIYNTYTPVIYDRDQKIYGNGAIVCNEVIFNHHFIAPKNNAPSNLIQARMEDLSTLVLMMPIKNLISPDHSKVAPNKDLTPTVYHFVIMDSYGRLVKEGTFLQNQLKITISNLALRKGMYFINLTSPSNSQTVKFLSYE